MTEINFAELHRNGTLDSFIGDLENLVVGQQKAIDKYKDRKYLAPIIVGLQKKVQRLHTLAETAVAFRNKFKTAEK